MESRDLESQVGFNDLQSASDFRGFREKEQSKVQEEERGENKDELRTAVMASCMIYLDSKKRIINRSFHFKYRLIYLLLARPQNAPLNRTLVRKRRPFRSLIDQVATVVFLYRTNQPAHQHDFQNTSSSSNNDGFPKNVPSGLYLDKIDPIEFTLLWYQDGLANQVTIESILKIQVVKFT